MNHRRPTPSRVGLASVLGVLVVFVFIAGCSEEEKRAYAIPGDLCGMPVDIDSLTPFFPPGKEVAVRPVSRLSVEWCDVRVDNKLALRISQTWWTGGQSTTLFSGGQTLQTPENSTEDGRYLYSGKQAFGKTSGCVDKKTHEELYTGVQGYGSKSEDADAMKDIIIDFTEAVEKSAACGNGPSQERS